MNEVYLWLVTAVTGAVGVNTLMRLWTDRDLLCQEELADEDRLFAWRIVLFLIYPLMTLIDLRATVVATQAVGGSISDWTYGLFWYTASPEGIHDPHLLVLALFCGCIVQVFLAVSLVPALLFRPHPFVASIIGYTIVAILAINLLVDPLLSFVGMGGSRWQAAMRVLPLADKCWLWAGFAVAALLVVLTVVNRRTRLWFARLTRPLVCELLTDAQIQCKLDSTGAYPNARLALLYERAGLRREALVHLKKLRALHAGSAYSTFVSAVLAYRQRRYKTARQNFLLGAEAPNIDPPLRGGLLAAAACAAFAEGDMEGALNLCERALEFDESSMVARMVKVDVFLRTGRKEQAGEEIVHALRRGLDIDFDHDIPIDCDMVLQRLNRLQVERTSAQVPLRN